MSYVDGYVLAVPTAEKGTYIDLATKMAPIFKKHGATAVCECWGKDVPEGKVTSFPRALKCSSKETIVFAWIAWPDKPTRDQGNKNAMAEAEALGFGPNDVPFDSQRMIFGGFETIVEA